MRKDISCGAKIVIATVFFIIIYISADLMALSLGVLSRHKHHIANGNMTEANAIMKDVSVPMQQVLYQFADYYPHMLEERFSVLKELNGANFQVHDAHR